MRRFVRDLTLFVMLQAVVACALFWNASNNPNTYLAATRDKHERLNQVTGPRMIFVGGSSVAFGINSEELGRRFPEYQPVNMGLHYGIGIDSMLTEIQPSIRSGDVVVLAPEYHHFGGGADAAILMEASLYRGHGYEQLVPTNWHETAVMLDYNALAILRTVTRLGFSGVKENWKKNRHNGVYSRGSFNEYGDMVGHLDKPATGKHLDPLFMVHFHNTMLQERIAQLNAFAADCQTKGATVYFLFAPIPEEQYVAGRKFIDEISQALEKDLKFPLLHSAQTSTAPVEMFFDAPYHLAAVGRERHTARVAAALEQKLSSDTSLAKHKKAEGEKIQR